MYEELIKNLRLCADGDTCEGCKYGDIHSRCDVAAMISNAAAALEDTNRLLDELHDDFVDYACSGNTNAAPYCRRNGSDCVDKRGWCIQSKCYGFSPSALLGYTFAGTKHIDIDGIIPDGVEK